jgi:phosphoglycerol transferase MdoB-like AlkP superfamily enzyme
VLKNLFYLIRFYLFWLIVFFLCRVVFDVYFHQKFTSVSTAEIIQSFFYAIRLDCSTAAYAAILPLLYILFIWFFPQYKPKPLIIKIYVWFCLLITSFLTILDLNIFREWSTKVNFRVFDTLVKDFSEAMASSGSSPIGLCLSIGALLLVSGIFISKYIINFKYTPPPEKLAVKIPCAVLLILINLMVMRGGLQDTPINQSMAYFSNKQILNQAALNTEWNLADNIYENLRAAYNPYLFFNQPYTDSVVATLYKPATGKPTSILTTDKPNVVIIQLESFTADIIQSLGGDKGVCPNFEKFITKGVLFDSVYSAGDRTDKGIVAILSGFPSQAIRTIITDNSKQERLPAITNVLKPLGYQTSYFYGGEDEYMNFKSYILTHNIDHITSKWSFTHDQMDSQWGVNDGTLFSRHLQYLNSEKLPFFSYIQTLTNHEPFGLPGKHHFPGDSLSNQFRSTAYYTDSCLNAYFERAEKQPWYKNTLFILVADHGHRLPRNTSESYHPAKYHIPLLFYGGAIKPEYRGKRISKLGGQTDIAATLLAQMNLPATDFKWSKDLLNPQTESFAFFDWDNGMGFMIPGNAVSYDNIGQRVIYTENPKAAKAVNDQLLVYAKAYLQQVFTFYMNGSHSKQ